MLHFLRSVFSSNYKQRLERAKRVRAAAARQAAKTGMVCVWDSQYVSEKKGAL